MHAISLNRSTPTVTVLCVYIHNWPLYIINLRHLVYIIQYWMADDIIQYSLWKSDTGRRLTALRQWTLIGTWVEVLIEKWFRQVARERHLIGHRHLHALRSLFYVEVRTCKYSTYPFTWCHRITLASSHDWRWRWRRPYNCPYSLPGMA